MQVHKVVFNMVTYGGETKKPTMLLTNSPGLCSMSNSSDKRKTDAAKNGYVGNIGTNKEDHASMEQLHSNRARHLAEKMLHTFIKFRYITPLSS